MVLPWWFYVDVKDWAGAGWDVNIYVHVTLMMLRWWWRWWYYCTLMSVPQQNLSESSRLQATGWMPQRLGAKSSWQSSSIASQGGHDRYDQVWNKRRPWCFVEISKLKQAVSATVPLAFATQNFKEEIAERKSKQNACRKDPGWLVGMCEAPERWKEESRNLVSYGLIWFNDV